MTEFRQPRLEEFVPLAVPNVGPAEAANLQACIDTTFVSTVGAFVGEFERGVAELSGAVEGVAMGAGTLALHMSLHGLGVGRGDLVVLPSFTFIASANSVRHTGADPWLFDVAEDWTLDPQQVADALARDTHRAGDDLIHTPTGRRVAALMPVYTLGTPADMEALGALAEDYGLPIVADAAAAIGVTYKGEAIGGLADLTCYSFNGNKTITSGGGGMVVGNDTERLARIRHISTTARVSTDYEHDEVGYNYRMTNLQAAVGVAQLGRLPEFLDIKRRIRARYDAAFGDVPGISPFPYPTDRESACWFSGLVLDEGHPMSAAEVCAALQARNIQARVFWKPVHLQAPYADAPRESMTRSENTYRRIVTLPCSTLLTDEVQDRVISDVVDILTR